MNGGLDQLHNRPPTSPGVRKAGCRQRGSGLDHAVGNGAQPSEDHTGLVVSDADGECWPRMTHLNGARMFGLRCSNRSPVARGSERHLSPVMPAWGSP